MEKVPDDFLQSLNARSQDIFRKIVQRYLETGAPVGSRDLSRMLAGKDPLLPPPTTMLGALYRYLREADPKHFQPMNANFGLLEPLGGKVKKDRKKELLVERAQGEMIKFLEEIR